MQSDATSAAQAARTIERQLDTTLERLRVCRAEPLSATVIAELTALRFEATRLARRVRLLHPDATSAIDLQCLDPAGRLLGELKESRAEAARRGIQLALQLQGMERVTRERKAIDVLAALVEDGVEAGATHLSMETRLRATWLELCLRTDAPLHKASFGVLMLGALARARSKTSAQKLTVRVERSELGVTTVALSTASAAAHFSSDHGAKRWTSLSPSRI
jgi:hypothetical protein